MASLKKIDLNRAESLHGPPYSNICTYCPAINYDHLLDQYIGVTMMSTFGTNAA